MNINIKNILKKIFSCKNIPVLIFFVLFNFVFVLQYITYDPMVSAFHPNPSWLLWSVIFSATIFLLVRYTRALWVRIFMFCVICISTSLSVLFIIDKYITGHGFDTIFWQYIGLETARVSPTVTALVIIVILSILLCASMVFFFQKKCMWRKIVISLAVLFVACLFIYKPLRDVRDYITDSVTRKEIAKKMDRLYEKHPVLKKTLGAHFAPTLPKNVRKRNVVWIYMEGLEQGYFDKGVMTHLENLRNHSLVLDNVIQAIGVNTINGEFSSQCAVPTSVLSSILTTITGCAMNVLHNNGWYSIFMKTERLSFANTYGILSKRYFDKMYGYKSYVNNKKNNKLTSKDISSQFGVNDQGLVKVAKQEYIKLMNKHQPFALVLATIDNHGGNATSPNCDFLKKTVKDTLYRKAACTDYNVWKLIQFMIKKAPKHSPPVFIIMSDHVSHNTFQSKKHFGNKRRLTFFIYDPAHLEHKVYHGMATHFDIPPTVLDYLGFKINRMRLGQSMLENKKGFLTEVFHNNVYNVKNITYSQKIRDFYLKVYEKSIIKEDMQK